MKAKVKKGWVDETSSGLDVDVSVFLEDGIPTRVSIRGGSDVPEQASREINEATNLLNVLLM